MQMENVTLPPYQIPYIIGATSYLNTTQDNVEIHTDNQNISKKEELFDVQRPCCIFLFT